MAVNVEWVNFIKACSAHSMVMLITHSHLVLQLKNRTLMSPTTHCKLGSISKDGKATGIARVAAQAKLTVYY